MLNSKGLFIGPYGENREEFVRLFELLFNDVVQWRRNFHPEDDRLVTREGQRELSFLQSQDKLHDALDQLLGEMKQSVPFHSHRFLGHMHSDLLIPALLGYFTGMLFNQNNVVGESSPITTRKEIEFCTSMCEMIGYRPFGVDHDNTGKSWGHLTSGGSTAILEAIWVARNMKYFPLSLKLLYLFAKRQNTSINQDIARFSSLGSLYLPLPNGQQKTLDEISFIELFNLSSPAIASLHDNAFRHLATRSFDAHPNDIFALNECSKIFHEAIEPFLVQHLGVQGIHQRVSHESGNSDSTQAQDQYELPLPLVYVSTAAHYSWKKNLGITGIGISQVRELVCEKDFSIDLSNFKKQLEANRDQPILLVVGMLGTTEEGAIDPIQEIIDMRKHSETQYNKSFFIKADGAWGGYFLSLQHESKDTITKKYFESHREYYSNILRDLNAARECDAIVIDPHKMGYVPYAAGSVFYKDTRYKNFIYKEAPYLATGGSDDFTERTYLGGWTLEGSRSGAAALACALCTTVLPLTQDGYGQLVLNGFIQTQNLFNSFQTHRQNEKFRIIPAYKPRTNILCFFISAPDFIRSGKYLNQLNEAVYRSMSIVPDRALADYNFVTSKTAISQKAYAKIIESLLDLASVESSTDDDSIFELTLLRSVILHPNLEEHQVSVWKGIEKEKVPLFIAFIDEMLYRAELALPGILLQIVQDKLQTKRRIKILWIENKKSFDSLRKLLETDALDGVPAIGKYLDITFFDCQHKNYLEQLKEIVEVNAYDYSVIDLNLSDNYHTEWDSGNEVLDLLYNPDNKYSTGVPILFSQFFNDPTSGKRLANAYLNDYPSAFYDKDSQFLPKLVNRDLSENDNEKMALAELVNRIFRLCQRVLVN